MVISGGKLDHRGGNQQPILLLIWAISGGFVGLILTLH